MAKKEWTEQERNELAKTLYGIIGANITSEEEDAIYDAISIISPEISAAVEGRIDQISDDFYAMMRGELPIDELEDENF